MRLNPGVSRAGLCLIVTANCTASSISLSLPLMRTPARTLGPQEPRVVPISGTLTPTHRVSLPCEVTCLQVPWIGGESLCGSLFSPPQSTPPLNLPCPRPPWGQDTVCIAFEAAGAASPWDWTISDFHRSHGKHLLSAHCVPGLLQGALRSAAALWSSVPGEGPGSYHEVISTPKHPGAETSGALS